MRASSRRVVGAVMHVIFFGTYDLGKPRNRILRDGLRANGVEVDECHADVWSGVPDKALVRGVTQRARLAARWLLSYPRLVRRYLRAPAADAVVVGYLGQLDVLVLWPFARLRGEPILWDAFLSLYDTIVSDRGLVGPRHPLARGIALWEWLACRAADHITMDTAAHAAYLRGRYGLAAERVGAFFVGAEPEAFPPQPPPRRPSPNDDPRATALFYGQLIPLHGIATIVGAARRSDPRRLRFVLIGRGQQEPEIRAELARAPVANLEWQPWVEYGALSEWLARADVCLGVFGRSGKASRVIPNKVFQILSARRPLVTRDSPAIRELVDDRTPGVYLVPPGDEAALLAAIERAVADRTRPTAELAARIAPAMVTAPLAETLAALAARR